MKLTLERRAVTELLPYEANSKVHTDEDVGAIGASIARFGFNDPIAITPEGMIVEGHGRWLAAQRAQIAEVPVLVIEGASEADLDLYRIAHNKIALSSTFDFGALFSTLQSLVGEGNDIAFGDMGFSDRIVDNLFIHFGSAEERSEEGSTAADGAPLTYDVVWDTKEDKARFSAFMAEEVRKGAAKSMGGEVLMAALAKADPELYAELVRAHPGEIPLDHLAGHVGEVPEEEAAHVTV